MAKVNPEHGERFLKYFEQNTFAKAISPIPEAERRAIMKSMRDKGAELLAELEAHKSVNFSREEFTDSVNKKELDENLVDLEEYLIEVLFERISENPSLIAHGEIGRMLKRVASKVQKMAESWETQQNFVHVVEKIEKLDTSSLRTKSDIQKDYMAIRAFYERAREYISMMFPDEHGYQAMEARQGNFSDDIAVPEIPICYSWILPVNMESANVRTSITDTPFFTLALEYGFINGATEKYDIIDFQNDVFKNIVLPILCGLLYQFPVGWSGGWSVVPNFSTTSEGGK